MYFTGGNSRSYSCANWIAWCSHNQSTNASMWPLSQTSHRKALPFQNTFRYALGRASSSCVRWARHNFTCLFLSQGRNHKRLPPLSTVQCTEMQNVIYLFFFCVCAHTHVCVSRPGQCWVPCSVVFRQGLLLNLELTILAGLASQQALGIYLSLPYLPPKHVLHSA